MKKNLLCFFLLFLGKTIIAQDVNKTIDAKALSIQTKLTEWRRHLHEHPELGNREFKTAAYIIEQLKDLGLDIQTSIAKTGVVAILKGGKPGPTLL